MDIDNHERIYSAYDDEYRRYCYDCDMFAIDRCFQN